MNYELPESTVTLGTGKTIYFIGQAITGEVNVPVVVANIIDVVRLFGSITESPLTKVYSQYYSSGGRDAVLVRIGGSNAIARVKAKLEGNIIDAIEFMSNIGGEAGNTNKVEVYTNGIRVYIGTTTSLLFQYVNYSSISDMCNEINRVLGTYIKAFLLESNADINTIEESNADTILFTGGASGLSLSKNELYIELDKITKTLLGRYMDLICLADMYLDDVTPLYYENATEFGSTYYTANRDYLDMVDWSGTKAGYHKLMIDFCVGQTNIGIDTHCIMGMNKLTHLPDSGYDFADMIAKASAVGSADGIRIFRADKTIDYGRHMSVVFGDMNYTDSLGNVYTENWAPSYAALWVNSKVEDSLSNTSIPGVSVSKYFSDSVIANLVRLGIVAYKFSPSYGLVVSGGITQALCNSAWYLASNVKITQKCLQMLYKDLYEYLSRPTEPNVTNTALSKVIVNSLNVRMNDEKIITGFDHSISYNKTTDLTTIEVELNTIYSLEKIIASTNIQI